MTKTIECEDCKKSIYYNQHYKCYECNCGKVYNEDGKEIEKKEEIKADFYY